MKTNSARDWRITSESHYGFTNHAMTRMAQRNLSELDVLYVLCHGQQLHRGGVIFFFLGQRDLPKDAPRWSQRLIGTTVLVDPWTRTIITIYRNRKALRHIKRKTIYSWEKACTA